MNAIGLLLAVALVTAGRSNAADGKPVLPILGWHGVPFRLVTAERYAQARDAGFTHLMQWAPDLKGALKALDFARSAGIKLLLRSPCIEGDRPEEAVRILKLHPALGLYHLKDEPPLSVLPKIGARARKIMSEDPAHPCYLNWCGVVTSDPMRWYGVKDYRTYIAKSLELVPIQMISFDKYPLVAYDVKRWKLPYRDIADIHLKTNWFETLEIVREVSRARRIPFWAFSIATAHHPGQEWLYPTATVEGMRLQQYANLAYGAQGLQYYTYWATDRTVESEMEYHDPPVEEDGRTTFVYDRLRKVNAELQSRAFAFVGADAAGVWHVGEKRQPHTRILSSSELPKSVKALDIRGEAIVSHLVNGSCEYLMVVCSDLHHETTFRAQFSGGTSRIRPDGSCVPTDAHSPEYVLTPGEAEVFRLGLQFQNAASP